jgi:hypothetical protein
MRRKALASKAAWLASIGLAAGAIALGYGRGESWRGTAFALGVGLLWLLDTRRDGGGMATVGLVSLVGAAAVGLWLGLRAGWMLFGVVAALSAWDLDHFARRLWRAEQTEKVRHLEATHLRRLAIVDGVALLISTAALGIRVTLGFGAALLLGGLAILGLTRAVGLLRSEDGSSR